LGGLAQLLPLPTIVLGLSALNLAGIPPLPIFYSKLLLFNAMLSRNIALAIIVVVSSAIAFLAYVRLLYTVVFGRKIAEKVEKPPASFNAVLAILAIAMLAVTAGMSIVLEKYVVPAATQSANALNYMVKP